MDALFQEEKKKPSDQGVKKRSWQYKGIHNGYIKNLKICDKSRRKQNVSLWFKILAHG